MYLYTGSIKLNTFETVPYCAESV